MRNASFAIVAVALAPLAGCTSYPFHMPGSVDVRQYTTSPSGGSALSALRLRPDVCEGVDLRADYAVLNEASFVTFLERQKYTVDTQRQQVDPKRPELHYVFVTVPGFVDAVPLRVAVLPNADDAGRALHEALLQYGKGSWGVHRGNIAVLGPRGPTDDDIAFASTTKLACWGTLTIAESGEAYVVPGGYTEP